MKTLGIVGGIAPESTVAYYRGLIALYQEKTGSADYPPILINSINMTYMLSLAGAGDLPALADFLLGELDKLAHGGAEVGVFASNVPHLVFDRVAPRSPIPLISIVETACDYARGHGFKKLGLFGTRFIMQGDVYDRVFGPAGIDLVRPGGDDLAYVQDKYLGELARAVFLPETRQGMLEVLGRLKAEQGIDGLILGGTELSLLLPEPEAGGVPLLHTGRIHVERAASMAWL